MCVQCKTPDDGQRNCPKHVQFYSKNKFEKLGHLLGFIIRVYHATRLPERQILSWVLCVIREVSLPDWSLSRGVPPSDVLSERDRDASRRKPWPSRSSCAMEEKKKPALLKLRLFNLFIRCFERMSLVLHLRYNLAGSSGDWFSFAVLHSRTFWRFAPHLRYYLEGSSGGWWRIFRPRSSHYLVLCFSFLRSLLLLLCRIFFVIGLYLSICFCAYNFALFVILLFLVSLFLPLRPPTPPHPTPYLCTSCSISLRPFAGPFISA